MEVSYVRNRLRQTFESARVRAQERRQRTAEGERAFERFLAVATPIAHQLAGALRAEGYAFTVSTPERGLRIAHERNRDAYVEFALDTEGNAPAVVGRIGYSRGSHVMDVERPVKPGAAPDAISEHEVLEFLLEAMVDVNRLS